MLIESLVKATVELQGSRVVSVTGSTAGLVAIEFPLIPGVDAAGTAWARYPRAKARAREKTNERGDDTSVHQITVENKNQKIPENFA